MIKTPLYCAQCGAGYTEDYPCPFGCENEGEMFESEFESYGTAQMMENSMVVNYPDPEV